MQPASYNRQILMKYFIIRSLGELITFNFKAIFIRGVTLTGVALLFNLSLLAQNDTISQRIILIGDAGQLTDGRHPVVDAVRDYIPLDNKTTILFLGDNLYKTGLPDRQYTERYNIAKAVLDTQVSIADGTAAKVYMIPGNHDWENGSRGGYDAIIRQQLYVDLLGKGDTVTYLPKEGCPGPEAINLGKDVVVIMFDSQWWLQPYDKPGIESDCKCKTKDELVTQIRDIATKNSDKLVILASHHPFKSNGIHGGFFTFKQHLFPLTDIKPNLYIPLPVIGSIYPIARSVFGTPQDLKHPDYTDMVNQISEAVKSSCPNVVFVSGHDHNLQYIKEDGYNYIISGGGCKQNRTSDASNSLFNTTTTGFSVLEVSKNNNVSVTFYTVKDSVHKAFSASMLSFKRNLPDTTGERKKMIDFYAKYKDSITVSASDRFPKVHGLKKLFMGDNYRQEWSAPVNMKVFKIGKEQGGFTILRLGGGKQTTALRLRNNKTREEWVLRGVNKNPLGSVPDKYRGIIAGNLLSEMISASHPYGALVVPSLAKALDIVAPQPQLFFVPDDPAFGIYRELFANKVCMLEEADPSIDHTDTKTTAKVFGSMLDDNDHQPDQQATLKTRLLDIVIGDYDRHFDQWKWGVDSATKGKEVKGKRYYPIPRDRDQAFFYSDGLLLKILSNSIPFLKGFREDIPRINWLGYRAKDFDRIFLTNLNAKQWEQIIMEVQQKLTDSVIHEAVQNMPPEISAIHGKTIEQKLVSRRNLLLKEGMKYYRFISKKINVVGSNQKEYFKVSNYGEGLQVKVYERKKNNDTSYVMYNRLFDPSVTQEIRLYGLNDDDIFDIEQNAKSRIKLRIIGGRGNDTFDIKGSVESLLYDLNDGANYIKNNKRAKNRFSQEPPLSERDILDFNYNAVVYPQFTTGYNTDDGWLLGGGVSARTYGFRNLPYATTQRLSALYAVNRNAFKLTYKGEFNHISRKTDLSVNMNYASPALYSFYGIGNRTGVDKSHAASYYQARYKTFEIETLLRKRFFDKLHIMFGPYFQHYNSTYKENVNTILGNPSAIGLDSASIFSKKNYLGGKFAILLNNTNNELFPTRGMYWYNEFISQQPLSGNGKAYTAYTTDMTLYASMKVPAKLIFIMRAGGGHIFSKNYEYFQAMSIGANHNQQGFRKNRFTGSASLYGGLEFRLKLFDVNSYILPGNFGLSGFADAGRVWTKPGGSKKWHTAFGAGLYYIPFNRFFISATAGFSEGEKRFSYSLGTKIGLHY